MRTGTVCSGRFGCGISVPPSLTGCRRVVDMDEGNNVTVKTQEGRRLSGRAYGPRDGDPVLFIAGAGMGKSMLFGEEVLPQHGIRVLTMDRPGMGASDPEPNRTKDTSGFLREVHGGYGNQRFHGEGCRIIHQQTIPDPVPPGTIRRVCTRGCRLCVGHHAGHEALEHRYDPGAMPCEHPVR